MDNAFTRAIYDRSPIWLRSLGGSAFGFAKNRRRYSGDFEAWAQLFRDAGGWPEERLRAYQLEKLRSLIVHADKCVPYYRDLFSRIGLKPGDIGSLEDFKALPILEKQDIIDAGSSLLDETIPSNQLNRYPTSGSTGTPLTVHRTARIEQMEWAFLATRFGPEEIRGRPYSSFTGLELLPPSRSKPPFWVDNWTNRQRMFSIFHMGDETMPAYVDALDRRYSEYYAGYPSAVFMIADFMLRTGRRLDRPPRYFLSASEELQPHYADTISEALGCEIVNRYGQNEFVGSITQRPCGHLHDDMDYSFLEFDEVSREEDGSILAEIIGTNFHDLSWPLIRYRTGDLVSFREDARCEAGHPGRIIDRIHGRNGRFFTLPGGRRITNISVIAKKCQNVRLMQVVQREPGAIDIRVVRAGAYGESDAMNIRRQFEKKIGTELALNLVYVDDIERTAGGKYISIINEVDSE